MCKKRTLHEKPIEWQEWNNGFKRGFIWGIVITTLILIHFIF